MALQWPGCASCSGLRAVTAFHSRPSKHSNRQGQMLDNTLNHKPDAALDDGSMPLSLQALIVKMGLLKEVRCEMILSCNLLVILRPSELL